MTRAPRRRPTCAPRRAAPAHRPTPVGRRIIPVRRIPRCALPQDMDLVGHAARKPQIVRDEQHRVRRTPRAPARSPPPPRPRAVFVQRGQRLVKHDQRGVCHQAQAGRARCAWPMESCACLAPAGGGQAEQAGDVAHPGAVPATGTPRATRGSAIASPQRMAGCSAFQRVPCETRPGASPLALDPAGGERQQSSRARTQRRLCRPRSPTITALRARSSRSDTHGIGRAQQRRTSRASMIGGR